MKTVHKQCTCISRGFTLLELIAAFAIVVILLALAGEFYTASLRMQSRMDETRAADQAVDAVWESMKSGAPEYKLKSTGEHKVEPLPAGVQALRGVDLRIRSVPWKDTATVRHVTVTLHWTLANGQPETVAREGLVSERLTP